MNNVAVKQNVMKTAIAKSFFEAKLITSIVFAVLFYNNIRLFMKSRQLLNRFSELTPILFLI